MATQRIPRLEATTIATFALTFAIAGCASAPSESSDAASVAPIVPVTSSASSAPSVTPLVSRPLSDFFEENPDDSRYSFYSFATPSGQIQCRVVGGGLPCQTEEHPHTVAESEVCGFYPGLEQGRAVRFGYFDERRQPCATIIQGDGFRSPHTLDYGQSVTAALSTGLTVTCTSAVEGLTCTQAGGTGPRGFFLSADSFRVF